MSALPVLSSDEVTAPVDGQQLVAAAFAWASRGVPVLPVRPAEKAPLTRHGLRDATTDAAVLRDWWDRWPSANVAIATGLPGVDVLDVDVRRDESGWPAVRRLVDAGVLAVGAPLVRTPSGGVHLYFCGTEQRNGSLPNEHIDFRSAGGYVLVPPSFVATESYEGRYRWERRGELNATLDWGAATALLRPPVVVSAEDRQTRRDPVRSRDVRTLAAAVAREREGNRNRLLFWALCEALRSGYDLRPIVQAGLQCGQTPREVEATRRQAVKRVGADGQMARSSPLRPLLIRSFMAAGSRPEL